MERRKLLGSFFGAALVPQECYATKSLLPGKTSELTEHAADRLERAKEFMHGLHLHIDGDPPDFLYQAGIVTQLGLTAFLFEKGLTDDWCKTQIGMDIEKALLAANRFGLELNCGRMGEFTRLLGPYGRWRRPFSAELPDPGVIQVGQASEDVRRMMEHIEKVLGR